MVENHPTSRREWGGRIHLPKSIGPALKICTKTTDQRMLCVAIRCTWQALLPNSTRMISSAFIWETQQVGLIVMNSA